MSCTNHEIGLQNDQFRKRGEDLVRAMIPSALPRYSPILGLTDYAVSAIMKFEFPEQETGLRNRGEVNIEGHVFKWEIGYWGDDHDAVSIEPTPERQRRVLTVYVPRA